MARNLKIRDLTLRDGQQSSFATRMNQEQIDRCLPFYKDANFYAMEAVSYTHLDVYKRQMPLYYCCMTPYDAKFTGLHILFDKENVPDTFGEWVSKQGLRQLRCLLYTSCWSKTLSRVTCAAG